MVGLKRIVLLVLLASSQAWSACSSTSYGNGWTCIQQGISSCSNNVSSCTLTLAGSATSGHQVIIGVFNTGHGITITGTDGNSDTFTASPSSCNTDANGNEECLFVITNVSATSSFGVNCSGTNAQGTGCFFPVILVSEWTGMATVSPYDSDGFFAGGTACTVSARSNANDLIYAFNTGQGAAPTPGTGYTEIGNSGSQEHEAESFTSTSTVTATWSGGTNPQGGCAAFKAGGAVAKTCTLSLMGAGPC
jgi:hypothetical protein